MKTHEDGSMTGPGWEWWVLYPDTPNMRWQWMVGFRLWLASVYRRNRVRAWKAWWEGCEDPSWHGTMFDTCLRLTAKDLKHMANEEEGRSSL